MNKIDIKLKNKCGIYMIFNILNGKRYIGSSNNLYNRLYTHYSHLKDNCSHNQHLQNAWNKYGEENFNYAILEYCNEDVQFEKEQKYISFMFPEYNKSEFVIANTNRIVTESTREKISNTLKNKYNLGVIKTYKQNHVWETTYLYDCISWKFIKEFEYPTLALNYISFKGAGFTNFKNSLLKERYIISKIKFNNLLDFRNYVYENIFIANSTKGKYIIAEKDGHIKYYRNLVNCAKDIGSSRSTLSKHTNATIENPYFTRTGYKFYYTNQFIPITDAVLQEESVESLSGNIGESWDANTEINLEITKGSKSSYSVEGE